MVSGLLISSDHAAVVPAILLLHWYAARQQYTGELSSLAAAHPEPYTALIDCCMRSNALQPHDMLAAAQLLAPAVHAVLSSEAALSQQQWLAWHLP
jgi:hypothetical protein